MLIKEVMVYETNDNGVHLRSKIIKTGNVGLWNLIVDDEEKDLDYSEFSQVFGALFNTAYDYKDHKNGIWEFWIE